MVFDSFAALVGAGLATGVLLTIAGVRGRVASPRIPGRWRTRLAARGRTRLRLLTAVVAGVGGLLLTGVPAVGLLAAVATPTLPLLWQAGSDQRRAIGRADAVAEWTRRLADQLATGSGLVAALAASADTAPAPITIPVGELAARLRAGTPPADALRRFAADLDDAVAEQVVAALLLHLHDRGDQVATVLRGLASDAAKVVAMRREVDAKRAQPRFTVRFMIVLAGVVTVLLGVQGLLAVYREPVGQLLLTVGAVSFGAVLAWVNAVTRTPVAPRFLASQGA